MADEDNVAAAALPGDGLYHAVAHRDDRTPQRCLDLDAKIFRDGIEFRMAVPSKAADHLSLRGPDQLSLERGKGVGSARLPFGGGFILGFSRGLRQARLFRLGDQRQNLLFGFAAFAQALLQQLFILAHIGQILGTLFAAAAQLHFFQVPFRRFLGFLRPFQAQIILLLFQFLLPAHQRLQIAAVIVGDHFLIAQPDAKLLHGFHIEQQIDVVRAAVLVEIDHAFFDQCLQSILFARQITNALLPADQLRLQPSDIPTQGTQIGGGEIDLAIEFGQEFEGLFLVFLPSRQGRFIFADFIANPQELLFLPRDVLQRPCGMERQEADHNETDRIENTC